MNLHPFRQVNKNYNATGKNWAVKYLPVGGVTVRLEPNMPAQF